MDAIEKRIKKYVYEITKGFVSLKDVHTKHIVEIANRGNVDIMYSALLYKKDYMKNVWELMRTTKVPKSVALNIYGKAGHGLNLAGFYRWDIYDENDEFFKEIFSVNSQLF